MLPQHLHATFAKLFRTHSVIMKKTGYAPLQYNIELVNECLSERFSDIFLYSK